MKDGAVKIYTMMPQNNEAMNRVAIALADLLRDELAPEFAEDSSSFAIIAGPPLTEDYALYWAESAKDTQTDIIYLSFELGREHHGPTRLAVFAERSGIIYRWADCVLWAPKDGGARRVMPKGLKMCFSHDGKALISHKSRPAQSLRNGMIRARARLLRTARAVTEEQLAHAEDGWRYAA